MRRRSPYYWKLPMILLASTRQLRAPLLQVSFLLIVSLAVTDTVAALWEELQRVRVMHVRGTPTTGQSKLADLFQEYVQRERPDIQTHLFNWPLNIKEFKCQNYYHLLNKLINEPLTRRDNWLKRQNTLIIINEAQRSYT